MTAGPDSEPKPRRHGSGVETPELRINGAGHRAGITNPAPSVAFGAATEASLAARNLKFQVVGAKLRIMRTNWSLSDVSSQFLRKKVVLTRTSSNVIGW